MDARETAAIAAWLPSVFDATVLVIVALASAAELLGNNTLLPPSSFEGRRRSR
jgi:hypothetical protein